MSSEVLQEHEIQVLVKLGVPEAEIQKYDVLCLPENIAGASSRADLVDAGDTIDLVKSLKEGGLSTAGSYELVPEAKTLERRGADLWLGTVWVLNNAALPLFLNILANRLTSLHERRIRPKLGSTADSSGKAHVKLRIWCGSSVIQLDYSGDAKTLARVVSTLKEDGH